MDVTLLYFEDCPSWKVADERLAALADAYYVDQSPYANLDTFEELATKNAGRVFEEMEFE